jgi:hypothetical protein
VAEKQFFVKLSIAWCPLTLGTYPQTCIDR